MSDWVSRGPSLAWCEKHLGTTWLVVGYHLQSRAALLLPVRCAYAGELSCPVLTNFRSQFAQSGLSLVLSLHCDIAGLRCSRLRTRSMPVQTPVFTFSKNTSRWCLDFSVTSFDQLTTDRILSPAWRARLPIQVMLVNFDFTLRKKVNSLCFGNRNYSRVLLRHNTASILYVARFAVYIFLVYTSLFQVHCTFKCDP